MVYAAPMRIDWSAVFEAHVAPVLAQHARPVPRAVLGVAAGVALAGVLVVALAPWPARLVGLVLLFIVGFGAVAATQKRRAARAGVTWVRVGEVGALRVEKFTDSDPATGATRSRPVHVLELALAEEGPLDLRGARLGRASGVARLTTSAELYAGLQIGQRLTGVSLPTAPRHVTFVVEAR